MSGEGRPAGIVTESGEISPAIGAVILAAGSSSRMGTPKQTLRLAGTSLLRHAAAAALDGGCAPGIVVTGAHAEASRRELEGLDVREVVNARWETGMASSIRVGIEALLGADPRVDVAVLLVCDQPHATAEVIRGLVAEHRATGMPVTASAYGGGLGVPAVFGRALFDELRCLEGASGAKELIRKHVSETHRVPFPGVEVDVDTPQDYARLSAGNTGMLPSRPHTSFEQTSRPEL